MTVWKISSPGERRARAQAFAASCAVARKVVKRRRFNRVRAAAALRRRLADWWKGGIDALFAYMTLSDGWDKLQRHCQMAGAASAFAKAMSDSDKKFMSDLLAGFGYFAPVDVEKFAAALMAETGKATAEAAGKFALQQLGIVAPQFDLRNPKILEALSARKDAAIYSTRTSIDEAMQSITAHFYELGQHPYNQALLDELKATLGYQMDWQAKRFALTETGIAAELAQVETYRRNGCARKQWNILDINTRPDHLELAGAVVGIAEKFNCGGFAADHPLDPALPADQVCNCHCWLSPVMDDEFEITPESVWNGE